MVAAPRVRAGAAAGLAASLCLLIASWLVLSIAVELLGQGALPGAIGTVLVGSAACMVLYAAPLEVCCPVPW
jgi:hypothetical protein